MRISITILTLIIIILGGLLYMNHLKVKTRDSVIVDRELQITGYLKILDAIAKSRNIKADQISAELEREFKIEKELEINKSGNGYFINCLPMKMEVNKSRLWDYMGGFTLEFDENKNLIGTNLYKP